MISSVSLNVGVLAQARDRGRHHVGQVGQREAFLLLELSLVRVTVCHHARHVDFLRLPRMRDRLFGARHVLGDEAAHARELYHLVAFGRSGRGGRARRRRGWRSLGLGGEILHVLLGHAAAEAGAGDLGEVDLEVGGGHLDAGGVTMALPSPLSLALSPGGRGARWLGSALPSPLSLSLSPGGRGTWRFLYRCFWYSRLRCGRGRFRSCCDRPVPGLHDRDLRPRLDRFAFLGEDLAQDAGYRRRDLGVDLVRVHLEHRLELDHLVARLDQPLRDGPFVDRLAELRHHDSRRLSSHLSRPRGPAGL